MINLFAKVPMICHRATKSFISSRSHHHLLRVKLQEQNMSLLRSSSTSGYSQYQKVLPQHVYTINNNNFSSSSTDDIARDKALRAKHILVKDENLAKDLFKDIKANPSIFDSIASEKSICPSKSRKGDLGWFHKGEMVKEFEEVCYNSDINSINLLKTSFGFHIIQVLDRANPTEELSVFAFADLLIDPDFKKDEWQIIDVREPNEIAIAEIKGYNIINAPSSETEEWGPKAITGSFLEKDKKTIVLCRSGVRSKNIADYLLREAGFKDVYNLTGGILEYSRRIDPSIPQY